MASNPWESSGSQCISTKEGFGIPSCAQADLNCWRKEGVSAQVFHLKAYTKGKRSTPPGGGVVAGAGVGGFVETGVGLGVGIGVGSGVPYRNLQS